MRITFTLLLFLFLHTFCSSQTDAGKSAGLPRYAIVIESLPPLSDPSAEISLDLEIQGTYFFQRSESMNIPDNYTVLIKDKITGNTFDLRSSDQHSFSVNRAMTKHFVIQVREATPNKTAITMK